MYNFESCICDFAGLYYTYSQFSVAFASFQRPPARSSGVVNSPSRCGSGPPSRTRSGAPERTRGMTPSTGWSGTAMTTTTIPLFRQKRRGITLILLAAVSMNDPQSRTGCSPHQPQSHDKLAARWRWID